MLRLLGVGQLVRMIRPHAPDGGGVERSSRLRDGVLELVLCGVVILGCLAAPAFGATAGAARQCGFVRASVPYSHHGHHDRWRIYVKGATSCASARDALNAVLHLNATPHYGTDNANSYFTFRGWTCDFGQMEVRPAGARGASRTEQAL